jgi:hypothetical protein
MTNNNLPEPGVALDQLVAEHVMGWTWYHYDSPATGGIYNQFVPPGAETRLVWGDMKPDKHPHAVADSYSRMVPHYSAESKAAHEVIDEMHRQGDTVSARFGRLPEGHDGWEVVFRESGVRATARGFAHAVCLAALKAAKGEIV